MALLSTSLHRQLVYIVIISSRDFTNARSSRDFMNALLLFFIISFSIFFIYFFYLYFALYFSVDCFYLFIYLLSCKHKALFNFEKQDFKLLFLIKFPIFNLSSCLNSGLETNPLSLFITKLL